jgi:hypothetical protein
MGQLGGGTGAEGYLPCRTCPLCTRQDHCKLGPQQLTRRWHTCYYSATPNLRPHTVSYACDDCVFSDHQVVARRRSGEVAPLNPCFKSWTRYDYDCRMRPTSLLKIGSIILVSTILLEVGCWTLIANDSHQNKFSGAILILYSLPMASVLVLVGVGFLVTSGCVALCRSFKKSNWQLGRIRRQGCPKN